MSLVLAGSDASLRISQCPRTWCSCTNESDLGQQTDSHCIHLLRYCPTYSRHVHNIRVFRIGSAASKTTQPISLAVSSRIPLTLFFVIQYCSSHRLSHCVTSPTLCAYILIISCLYSTLLGWTIVRDACEMIMRQITNGCLR